MLRAKRVYEKTSYGDGRRVLVDRLWPRGLSKEKADIDEWLKDIAPSNELREWFRHDPGKWEEFKKKYREELNTKGAELKGLADKAEEENLTLLYAARDSEHNNAVALMAFLEELKMHRKA